MEAFDKVLNDFYTNGATETELKKFKTMMKNDVMSVEEPLEFSALINPFVYKDYSKRKMVLTDVDAIDNITLMKVIKKYFMPESYKCVIAGDDAALSEQLSKIQKLQKLDLNVIEKDQ
jgi:predicted Zn-dependent peptidase